MVEASTAKLLQPIAAAAEAEEATLPDACCAAC